MREEHSIYKYPLPLTDVATIEMPQGAYVLSAQVQRGDLFIWAMVNPDNPREKRHFRIAGTGHVLEGGSSDYLFIDTVQLSDGVLVLHVFEDATRDRDKRE